MAGRHALRAFQHLGGDLFLAVCRQAVHEQRLRVGQRHQGAVDLERGKGLGTASLFLLLSHAGPDIGDHQMGAARRLGGIMQDAYPVAGAGYDVGIRLVAFGTGHIEPEMSPRSSNQVCMSASSWQG